MFKKFNDWVASQLPGWKTKGTALLGSLGMFAISLQGYISGLPLDKFMSSKTVALISGGLFTLTYWFKTLSKDKKS